MRRPLFVLALVVAAALGAALGWASRAPSGPERPREAGPAVGAAESPAADGELAARKMRLVKERTDLTAGAGAPPLERVAPRTIDEYMEFLSKLILRKATSDTWPRWIERFEAFLAADPRALTAFLAMVSGEDGRRSFALTVLKEMSHDFLCRPEVSGFVRTLAQDPSAQALDRALAIGLAAGCWEPDDPAAWATLANLAQFDKEELVRQVALGRLQSRFEDDPRTKRLLADSWWREADPRARAGKLLSMLPSLDPSERAETIARALREDRSKEVKIAAAGQVFQDLLAPDRPMSPEQRRATTDVALAELTPHADLELRRVLVMSALAAGDEAQLRAVAEYLATREPDAKLKAWGEATAKRLLDAGASRDEEFLRSLWGSLRDLADPEKE